MIKFWVFEYLNFHRLNLLIFKFSPVKLFWRTTVNLGGGGTPFGSKGSLGSFTTSLRDVTGLGIGATAKKGVSSVFRDFLVNRQVYEKKCKKQNVMGTFSSVHFLFYKIIFYKDRNRLFCLFSGFILFFALCTKIITLGWSFRRLSDGFFCVKRSEWRIRWSETLPSCVCVFGTRNKE